MHAYTIGLSALAAGQRGLDLVGQNIANASTPGYTRQGMILATRTIDGTRGAGVDIASITRYTAPAVRTSIRQGGGEQAAVTTRLDIRRQIETVLPSGPGGIADLADQFFNQVGRLTARPDDPTARRVVVTALSDLTERFHTAAADITRLRADTGRRIGTDVTEINDFAKRIAALNRRIAVIEAVGDQANDLRDQRDRLIDDLSERIDVQTVNQPHGVVNVVSSGAMIVVGTLANEFRADLDASGNMVVTGQDGPTPIAVRSGSLGGLLREFNQDIPATRARLDELANGFMRAVDQVQATGLGPAGPMTALAGTRGVYDPTAPLSTQVNAFPLRAGNLVVSLTDTATGVRTNSAIAIDPATQSLQDVAAAITAGTGGRVQATVDPLTNTLRFAAQPGTRFDFAGRPESPPQNVAMNGTAVPTVGGAFTGAVADNYSFRIVGSGTVGLTQGLSIEVRDSANQVLATANVGAGYTPGAAIPIGNGITVALGPGTTDNGTFASGMIPGPDTAGVLPALGINGLFTGTGATGIAVRPDLLTNPNFLSTGLSDAAGDGTNLERLAAARDGLAFAGGRTFTEAVTDLAGEVGLDVKTLDDTQTAQASILEELSALEQGTTGVDINEELVHMLDYQRMIQSASKFIATVNEAIDSIMEMMR